MFRRNAYYVDINRFNRYHTLSNANDTHTKKKFQKLKNLRYFTNN